jgi:biopolymer transport protein TolR
MDIGKGSAQDRSPIAQINITPLVDVMLVLLIIFMVTAAVGQQGISVSLPRAKAGAIPLQEELITVTIDASLGVYVNAKPVKLEELKPAIVALYAKRKSKAIFLKSDKSVAYGDFIKVVSVIKDSGVEQLGMITEPPKR